MGNHLRMEMRLRRAVVLVWAWLLWSTHAALDAGELLPGRPAEILDLGEEVGEEAQGGDLYAVSGDLRLRNKTAEQSAQTAQLIEDAKAKRRAGPILQYKTRKEPSSKGEQAKESKSKAELARRMNVKDKIRELGKARPKTGAIAPVLQTTALETVVADFIQYGCVEQEPPPAGMLPTQPPSPAEMRLGDTASVSSDEACAGALSGEEAICTLYGAGSRLCKQLKASNAERCAVRPLGEAMLNNNQTKSCHADCRECVGVGPKKCTSCAELKAFVTLTPGDGGGECRKWPLSIPVARGTRDADGRLMPPKPDVTTEIHQALTSGKVVTEKYGVKQLAQTAAEWQGAPAGITEFIPQCSWWKQVTCTKNKKYAYSTCKEKAGCKDGKKPSWLKTTPEECIVDRCEIKKLARVDRICFRNDKEYKNLCEGWYGQQEEETAMCECYA